MAASAPETTVAQVQSLDRFQAEQERLRKLLESQPKAYQDKVMDTSSLPPLPEEQSASLAQGFRSYSSETRFGASSVSTDSLSRRSTEFGQRFEYRQETLNYGDFVAQVDARISSGQDLGLGFFGLANEKSSSRITLRNIGFPVTSRLFADTSVGDISSETTDALARAYRLSLGTGTVRGAGVRLFDGISDVRVGTGLRGNLIGGPYPGFERNQGTLSWLGYSRRLQNGIFGGVQVTRATDVTPFSFFSPIGVAGEDVSALAASIGYGGDLFSDQKSRARLTYVRSTSSGTGSPEPRNAQGLFVEAGLRAGAYRHEFGAYSAEPNLRFGDAQLASDNRGAYWRVDTSGLRYAWGVGMDTDLQNPDREGGLPYARRLGINADGQYRLNRNNSFGGALQVSFNRFVAGSAAFGGVPLPQIDRESRSVYASGYYQTRFGNWGPTRLRGTLRRNEVLVANDIAATGQEIEWEQDWIIGRYETQRPELLTTLGVARDRSSGTSETQPTAGVSFRLWPTVDWDVSGSLRYISRDSNLSTSRGLSGTVSSEHVLPRGWRLGAAVSLNQAVVNVNGVAGLGISTVSRSNDKSAWLYLRWDGSSGTPYQVAGLRGAGGSVGGGSLQGFVFFDSNRDGEQQPGEGGVPAVEVFLDGRFRATTDRDGRFVFPLVATGAHQLTLTLETVPLPWGVAPEQGNVKVEVPLRGQATARIPVVRVGE